MSAKCRKQQKIVFCYSFTLLCFMEYIQFSVEPKSLRPRRVEKTENMYIDIIFVYTVKYVFVTETRDKLTFLLLPSPVV